MSMYAKLARSTAEEYVRSNQELAVPAMVPRELTRQRACFVSVFENPGRRLRAMYGEPLPQRPTLAHEIITNTIKAITENPARRIRRADLSYLSYAVALLGPLQRITDPEHLDPKKYGLYVKSNKQKFALLLPGRVGVETGNDQIATALRESQIDTRQEDVSMYRFEVTNFEE